MSHAAPKYHFGDRAGLLTAIATEGFLLLAAELNSVIPSTRPDPAQLIGTLGRTYIDFSFAHPALFDLMFRPGELRPDDVDLLHAQREAIGVLNGAVAQTSDPGVASPLSLMSWALAHGIAVLARDGALQAASGTSTPAAAVDLAREIVDEFARLAGGGATPR